MYKVIRPVLGAVSKPVRLLTKDSKGGETSTGEETRLRSEPATLSRLFKKASLHKSYVVAAFENRRDSVRRSSVTAGPGAFPTPKPLLPIGREEFRELIRDEKGVSRIARDAEFHFPGLCHNSAMNVARRFVGDRVAGPLSGFLTAVCAGATGPGFGPVYFNKKSMSAALEKHGVLVLTGESENTVAPDSLQQMKKRGEVSRDMASLEGLPGQAVGHPNHSVVLVHTSKAPPGYVLVFNQDPMRPCFNDVLGIDIPQEGRVPQEKVNEITRKVEAAQPHVKGEKLAGVVHNMFSWRSWEDILETTRHLMAPRSRVPIGNGDTKESSGSGASES
jgi:hypothetical protein